MNPVDDTAFTRPLVKALRGHVDACAASMAQGQTEHDAAQRARPAAVAWVFYSVLVAWAEDHHLIDPWLRGTATAAVPDYDGAAADWLALSFGALAVHPGTRCLLDPRYSELQHATPGDAPLRALLAWWATQAPSLAYETDAGPASVTGWLPGDLLQALSAERVKGNAFCQTPWWVADFLLDRTLVPACEEFRQVPVLRSIDPTCGAGHIMARTVDYLWEWYTTGQLAPRQATGGQRATGGHAVVPVEAVRRIIAGVHGCEKDPLTASVARLRMVAIIGDLLHRSGAIRSRRLDAIPAFTPVVAVGDSLLAGLVSREQYATVHPTLAEIHNLGYATEAERARNARC